MEVQHANQVRCDPINSRKRQKDSPYILRRWALLSGSIGNVGASWPQDGVFQTNAAPPSLSNALFYADRDGKHLWMWSGTSASDRRSTSVWCFRLADRLWARVPSPFTKALSAVQYGPPYWSQSQLAHTWSFNGTVYEFGGEEFRRDVGPGAPLIPRVSLWKAVMTVGEVSFPFQLEIAPPSTSPEPQDNRGATVSYFFDSSYCPRTRFEFVSFPSERLRFRERKTGALLNYEWGTVTPPVSGIARTTCFAVENVGYYWSNEPTTQLKRILASADDGVQLEWRDRGIEQLFSSNDNSFSAWADHSPLHFSSRPVLVYPGPNWFRCDST